MEEQLELFLFLPLPVPVNTPHNWWIPAELRSSSTPPFAPFLSATTSDTSWDARWHRLSWHPCRQTDSTRRATDKPLISRQGVTLAHRPCPGSSSGAPGGRGGGGWGREWAFSTAASCCVCPAELKNSSSSHERHHVTRPRQSGTPPTASRRELQLNAVYTLLRLHESRPCWRVRPSAEMLPLSGNAV